MEIDKKMELKLMTSHFQEWKISLRV